MTKAELFVIKTTNAQNETKYYGFDAQDRFIAVESPMDIAVGLSKEDAVKLVQQMRKSNLLEEGQSIRAKAITQAVRDYCGLLIKKVSEITMAGTNRVEEVVGLYPEPIKETKKAKKTETTEEKVEVEIPKEEVKTETKKAPKKKVKSETTGARVSA